jgi:hypothetical protein
MAQRSGFNFKLDGLTGIVFFILFLVGVYMLIQGIYTLLYYASPFLLIGALLVDYKSVLNYGKWIVKQLQSNPILGIGIILINVLVFPFVCAFLFAKSLFKKKIRDITKDMEAEQEGQFIEYEEVKTERLELPPMPKKEPQKRTDTDSYEQLFED